MKNTFYFAVITETAIRTDVTLFEKEKDAEKFVEYELYQYLAPLYMRHAANYQPDYEYIEYSDGDERKELKNPPTWPEVSAWAKENGFKLTGGSAECPEKFYGTKVGGVPMAQEPRIACYIVTGAQVVRKWQMPFYPMITS